MATNSSSITILPSAARIADATSDAFINTSHRGALFTIDVTLDPSTAAVTFNVQSLDEVSGVWSTILASAALAAVGTVTLAVYPGITVAANLSASANLPRVYRVFADAADVESLTYSVSARLLI